MLILIYQRAVGQSLLDNKNNSSISIVLVLVEMKEVVEMAPVESTHALQINWTTATHKLGMVGGRSQGKTIDVVTQNKNQYLQWEREQLSNFYWVLIVIIEYFHD